LGVAICDTQFTAMDAFQSLSEFNTQNARFLGAVFAALFWLLFPFFGEQF
jgi:hypothetical protein